MSKPGVGSGMVSLLRDYLLAQGQDAEALLGPQPAADAIVSVARWQQMLAQSAAAVSGPAFGLRLAQQVSIRHFGVVGYLALSCASAMEALERCMRYTVLVAEHNPTQMRMLDGELQLSWPLLRGPSGLLWDELSLGIIVQMVRLVAGPGFAPSCIAFSEPEPAAREVYDAFFRCPLQFSQEAPAISIPLRALQAPLQSADPDLLALLDEQAAEKLQRRVPVSGELHRIRQQLLQLIREGRTRLDDLAALNHIGPRALQRRLATAGVSYQSLLDDTRRHMAEQYLADPGLELHEVAALLGYSEQSSFTRAFQQWTGETPGQWRRQRS